MAEWATTLVSGGIGIAGVAVGAFLQYQQERAKERRQRLFIPAADMAARLRGAASSLDYVVHGLVAGESLEGNVFENAKHYVWEADASRAGIEFAFQQSTQVFALATTAVERLKEAYDVALLARENRLEGDKEEKLKATKAEYDTAIEKFVGAAQDAAKR